MFYELVAKDWCSLLTDQLRVFIWLSTAHESHKTHLLCGYSWWNLFSSLKNESANRKPSDRLPWNASLQFQFLFTFSATSEHQTVSWLKSVQTFLLIVLLPSATLCVPPDSPQFHFLCSKTQFYRKMWTWPQFINTLILRSCVYSQSHLCRISSLDKYNSKSILTSAIFSSLSRKYSRW